MAAKKTGKRPALRKKAAKVKAKAKKVKKTDHPTSEFVVVLFVETLNGAPYNTLRPYKQIGPRAHKNDLIYWYNATTVPLWVVFDAAKPPVSGTIVAPNGGQGVLVAPDDFSTPVTVATGAAAKKYQYKVYDTAMKLWEQGPPDGPAVDVDP